MADTIHNELLQTYFNVHVAYAVFTLTEHGIPDQIPAGQSVAVSALAQASGFHPRVLYRIMRLLASHGYFVETASEQFAHTPKSLALRGDSVDSFKPATRLMGFMLKTLGNFEFSLRTGKSALTAHLGAPLFEYLPQHPETAAMFDQAMPSFHSGETAAMLEAYDFSDIATLADIGGGSGMLMVETLQRYRAMKGVLYDLPHAIGHARGNIGKFGLENRCRLESGDFFAGIPAGADAYLMRHIVHDWSDEDTVRILRNCRKAIAPTGKLLIVEAVIPEGNGYSIAKEMDITMVLYPGGEERTEQEYRTLFAQSGFELTRIVPTASMVSVVEGRPV